MAQHPIELILARRWADTLAVPIFLLDPDGNLIFYNEGAEAILGLRYEETGEMAAAVWVPKFEPYDADGAPVPRTKLPLWRSLVDKRPSHLAYRIRGLDGVERAIEVTATPLIGSSGRMLGAIAMFWEEEE